MGICIQVFVLMELQIYWLVIMRACCVQKLCRMHADKKVEACTAPHTHATAAVQSCCAV